MCAMMGNPNDLELLSGLDDDGGMMGYEAFNALAGYDDGYGDLAGYDPELMGAMMGFNPLSWIRSNPGKAAAIGAGALGVGLGARALLQRRAAAQRAAALRNVAMQRQIQASPYAQPVPMNMLVSQVPGASARGTRFQPLGFTPATFTATSGTTLTVRARPQRPLRGGRLFGSFARVGTTATGLLTLVSLFVGTDGQLLSGDPISFDALAPNSFGAGINLTPAAVGQEIVAVVSVSAAPTMTDTIPFNLTLFGMSIG